MFSIWIGLLGSYRTEPRLNATLTFTLHGKATFNATDFWLFFVVAYVSPFKFCSVMSDQQQRDMDARCDKYATIYRRLNATILRIQLPSPLVNNFAREARPHEPLCCHPSPPPVVDLCIGVKPI